ncbi:MAG: hypothetical protein HY010_02465 [Acidobacteria bacterium]|nr:hypothetical protein [Acidobacteriota bacterium]
MSSSKKFMVGAVLFAMSLSSAAFAASTHKGTAQAKVTVVSETNALTTSSNAFVDLPGGVVAITVPANKKQLITTRYTAESICAGPTAGNWCSVRIVVVDSSNATTELSPASGFDYAFDAVNSPQTFWQGHAVDRSIVLASGTYFVKVQWGVTDPASTFRLDDWSFTVTQSNGGN